MTTQLPPSDKWESLADQRIRRAIEAGEFDDLPGAGRPIPGDDKPPEEMWWLRQLLRREGLSVLPPTLATRVLAEKTMAAVRVAADESTVQRLVETLNQRIREADSSMTAGPPSTVGRFDVDEIVRRWAAGRI
jgi:hypothetical protein